MEFRKKREDSLRYQPHSLRLGQTYSFTDTVLLRDRDTFVLKQYSLRLEEITREATHPDYKAQQGDLTAGAVISVKRDDDDSTYTVTPMVILRGQLVYYFPSQINELSARVRLHPDVFDQIYTPEESLTYKEFTFKQGQIVDFEGLQLRFDGFNPKAEHPALQKEESDLAVGARMSVLTPQGGQYQAQPVFFIRDNTPFNLKDEVENLGLHLRFLSLDPKTETIQLMAARKLPQEDFPAAIELATNSLRSDYIVMEAIEFPGINLFWLGSTLMMLGLGLSMTYRIGQLYKKERA